MVVKVVLFLLYTSKEKPHSDGVLNMDAKIEKCYSWCLNIEPSVNVAIFATCMQVRKGR